MPKFVRPTKSEIRDALGPVCCELVHAGENHKALDLESGMFKPIRKPREGDWLREHHERGQPHKSFMRSSFRAVPHGSFDAVYIQPLGDFKSPRSPDLGNLKKYIAAFFPSMKVRTLPCVCFAKSGVPSRTRMLKIDEGHSSEVENEVRQCSTEDIFEWFKKHRVTAHREACRSMLLGVVFTSVDIYPVKPDIVEERGWLRGLAVPMDGLGIVSWARHDPDFPVESPEQVDDEERRLMLKRNMITLTHEICHLFGLYHCIYFSCLMNGVSENMEDYDHRLFLCPVCLHKLHIALKFDPNERYENILEFLEDNDLDTDAQWVADRLDEIEKPRPLFGRT